MIKKIIVLTKEKIKKLFNQFPVSMISIIILGFFLSIFIDSSLLDSDLFEQITLFLVFFIMGSLFSESFFRKKKYGIYIYFIFAIISFILAHFSLDNNISSLIFKLMICYIVIVNLMTLYKLYKNSKENVSTYLVSAFSNILRTGIIYFVLVTGLFLIFGIFNNLILGGNDYDFVFRLQILLLTIYFIPSIIHSISDIHKEDSKIIKVIIHYIALIQISIAFVIVYFYMLKIIITLSVPSNEVFRILGVLFIIAFPIWMMNDYYKDEPLYKLNHYLPLSFIPFIPLEIYSLGIRIINNGITNVRYLGIILIIFEIIFIWFYYKKDKLEYILFSIIGLTIISILIPFVNMFDVSNLSQTLIIKKNIDDNSKITNVVSAYRYLKDNFDGDKYIDRYLKDEYSKILELDEIKINNDLYRYLYANIPNNTIEMKGYQKITPLSLTFNEKIKVRYINNVYDITEKINIYASLQNDKELDDYFKENNEIIIDDNIKIILQSIDLRIESDKIVYGNLDGYILEK